MNIPALYNSKWPWKKYSEFTEYYRENDNVVYWGIEFKTGDIFVLNLNPYSDNAFVLYGQGKELVSHIAIYIYLITEEGRFPAIFEVKQSGFRLVPLNVYLNDHFTSWWEVLRIKDLPADAGERLSETTLRIIPEEHGFNLYADDKYSNDDQYVTCVTAIQYLFRHAGFNLDYPVMSDIDPKILENIKVLGFETKKMQTPSDFLQWKVFL